MKAFLYGISSFSEWLTRHARPGADCAVDSASMTSCKPNQAMVSYLNEAFPFIPQPYHLTAPSKAKNNIAGARAHFSSFAYRGKPFLRVGSGVYASCPELCFVELARSLPLHELIKAGNALCGRFFIDPAASGGLGTRDPLTSVRRIEAFIERNLGMHGAKQARRALSALVNNAASPPEGFLWSILCLPQRFGGYGIPRLTMNHRLYPSKRAQGIAHRKTLIPDLLHKESRLVVEYDSNAEHLTASQITRDTTKRMALEADGYKVITVTTRQLSNPAEMRNVAAQINRHLSRRTQVRGKAFTEQHRLLYAAGWSLVRYLRATR